MRKTILLLTITSFLLYGCGEAGVESNISKKIEREFTVDQNTPRVSLLDADDAIQNIFTIDPNNDEFSEYIGDLDQYFLNSIELQVLSVEATPPLDLTYFGFGQAQNGNWFSTWATGNNYDTRNIKEETFYNLLTNANAELAAGEPILIYDADDRDSDVFFYDGTPPEIVSTFLTDLISGFTQEFWVGLWADDYPAEYSITVKLTIDLTARAQLD